MKRRMVISISLCAIAVIVIAGIAAAAPSPDDDTCYSIGNGSARTWFIKNQARPSMDGCNSNGDHSPAPKVDVCHILGNGNYILINISENALPAHLDHGDGQPGHEVPGMPAWYFDEECVPYQLMSEVLFVDSFKSLDTPFPPVESTSFNTKLGTTYQLVATGEYRFAPWGDAGIADAKFTLRIPNEPFSFHDNDFNTWVDGAVHGYRLQVVFYEGSFDLPLSPVGWVEDFNMAHVYTAYVDGDGGPLEFYIYDTLYQDNVGGITVNVQELP